jgi:hypothetical protein
MKRMVKLILVLVFIAAFSGCSQQEAHVQGNAFYFYPKPNIYYDIEKKEYYVFSSAGNKWEIKTALTENEKAMLGEKVVIDTPSVPVYANNADHRILYSASLYSDEREIREKYIEDSLKSVPKKPDTTAGKKKEVLDEKESGIKKFFKKIFGKNKEEEKKDDKQQ